MKNDYGKVSEQFHYKRNRLNLAFNFEIYENFKIHYFHSELNWINIYEIQNKKEEKKCKRIGTENLTEKSIFFPRNAWMLWVVIFSEACGMKICYPLKIVTKGMIEMVWNVLTRQVLSSFWTVFCENTFACVFFLMNVNELIWTFCFGWMK